MSARAGGRLAVLALVAAGCAAADGARGEAQADLPPASLSAIQVRGADGGAVALGSVLGGRPALVSFWAPWCEPCVKELPELDRLARAVEPCGAAVVGVAVGEPPASAAAFARARGTTFPQFSDEEFHLADALGQRRIPALVVLDRQQRIVFSGEALERRAIAALEATLARATGATGDGQAACAAR